MPDGIGLVTEAPAATAAKAIAGALVRQAITAGGTALVAHRIVDQQTADSVIGPVGDYVVRLTLTCVSAVWGVLRARLMHARWAQAWVAPARPLPPATPPAGA